MRVELSSLAETMFYENKEQYLDSKNGRIIDDSLPYEASKHGCLRIPKYSVAYCLLYTSMVDHIVVYPGEAKGAKKLIFRFRDGTEIPVDL